MCEGKKSTPVPLVLHLNALLIIFGMASSHALEMPFPSRDFAFAVIDSGVKVYYNSDSAVQ